MTKIWKDKTILVTGAGSGIGAALTAHFAALGAQMIITDIDQTGLDRTHVRHKNNVVFSQVSDVTKKSDWQALEDRISTDVGYLDVLINNAGMTSFGLFEDTSEELFNKVVDVNLNGVVLGCRTMLPLLEKSKRGMIVNVASIFGLITMPLVSPYHAAKFAVRGFTEALKQDMLYAKKNIDVICVMPGGIKTNIAKLAETDLNETPALAQHFDTVARTSAEKAAKVIEKGMRKKQFRVLIGPDAKIVDLLYKILPTHYYKVSNLLLGVNRL